MYLIQHCKNQHIQFVKVYSGTSLVLEGALFWQKFNYHYLGEDTEEFCQLNNSILYMAPKWSFECSFYFFRGPWFNTYIWKSNILANCNWLQGACFVIFVKIPIVQVQYFDYHVNPSKLSKTGPDKIIYWLHRYSFFLGFVISKNARGCVLNFSLEYRITNLFSWHNKTQEERVSTKSMNLIWTHLK